MDDHYETFLSSSILLTVFVGSCVLLLMYVVRMLKNENQTVDIVKNTSKDKHKESSVKSKKKTTEPKWTGRSDKQNYSHPWLMTTFKGHTDQVLDMDFSSHGKYLASCAEEPDPDPGGDLDTSSTSSSSDCNKENDHPPNQDVPASNTKGLSRRQRKNRRRDDSSSPETKKKPKKRMEVLKRPPQYAPLKQFSKLNLADKQLYGFLRHYLLCPEQALALGYPVESELHPGRAIIFKSPLTVPKVYNPFKICRFDVNAREFIPTQDWSCGYLSGDSGQCSGSSSDSSDPPEALEDSDSGHSSEQDPTVKNSVVCDTFNQSEERECVRCGNGFLVASDGEYLTQDHCVYHWGKLHRDFNTNARYQSLYTCCRNKQGSTGCITGKLHVWNGVGVGFNGPFDSYVRTKPRKTPPLDGNFGVYALDCEMCYTVGGLELAKITVVSADGRLVYDCFVRPENDIVDYNTRFSGVTAKDLNRKTLKTLKDVQNDLMGFINADTILVGHGLENDLRALKIIHSTVVDTAVTFPHYNGLPYRRSLKSLTTCFLKRDIQCDASGHNSYEDARACMELMLWRVHRSVMLWDTKQLAQKEHKSMKVNVDFDYATLVKWSPDCKAFIINRASNNAMEVYKVEKKKDGWFGQVAKALTFPKVHLDDVVGLGIASNGKFIMTCSNKTEIVLLNLQGKELARIDTYLMYTTAAKISPCGKFIAASGFAPDAKIWEVSFTKAGDFQNVKRAFELTGHSSQIYDLAFDALSTRMATVSKDGTWRVYNIEVEYTKGEDPRLITSGEYNHEEGVVHIALSPNAEVVAISVGNTLSFYSVHSGLLDATLTNIYSGPITCLMFDSLGKYILTSGDKHIRAFHNVTGYKCNIVTAKSKLKQNNTSATKERLENIVAESLKFLQSIEK